MPSTTSGPTSPGGESKPPKKPSAIIDVKATAVDVEDAHKAAAADAGGPGLDPAAAGKDDPEAASVQTTPSQRKLAASAGLLTHVAAGLAGGLLTFVAIAVFGPQFGRPLEQGEILAQDIERRLRAIETAAAGRPAAPAELVQKLGQAEQRLARLEDLDRNLTQVGEAQAKLASQAEALEDKLSKLGAGDNAQARLAKLEETLKTLSAAAADPQSGRIPQLAALSGKLDDLEATIASQKEANEAARAGAERLDRELAGVKADASRLTQRVEALRAADDRLTLALRSSQEETAGFKSELAKELQSVVRAQDLGKAIASLSGRLSGVERDLQSLVRSEEDRNANAGRIVLALELGNLKRVVERGVPYANELAEVNRVSGGRLNLAVLDRYKSQGVPSIADLAREFHALAHAVIDAETEVPDASILDRLLASAKSIVRVRKVSHGAGDTGIEAVVARMETGVKDANLPLVLEAAKQLSPRAMAPARTWLDKVEARVAVDRAITEIDTELKGSLGARPQADRRG
jgi:hypothetical protein